MNRRTRSFLAAAFLCSAASFAAASPRVVVTLPPGQSGETLTGRLLLVLSTKADGEPREHVSWDGDAVPFFGMDVENWRPGEKKVFDSRVDGFPIRSLDALPPGEYRIQAVLNRYEKFTRSDGRTLLLPPDRGEGQVWRSKPGNLYSKPLTVRFDGKRGGRAEIVLDQAIPPVEDFAAKQTKYVRHFSLRSERLSTFWGRDVTLAAWVRLPWGYDEHPNARYPLVIAHGHFPAGPDGFRETPPDPALKPDYSSRATTASSRSTPGRRTRTGSRPDFRACCWSRSSIRPRSMTIPMR